MADFTAFLDQQGGQGIKPKPLPIEIYPGIVAGYEYGDNNKNHTPYCRYQLKLTGWPQSIPDSSRVQLDAEGREHLIDISKRNLRVDYFLTDEAKYRLDEFLKTCGLDPRSGKYSELCPQVVGCQVSVEVKQYLNPNTNEVGNQAGRVFGPNSL